MSAKKLTDEQVMSIPNLVARGLTWNQISKELHVGKTVIGNLTCGTTYKHLQDKFQKAFAKAREEANRIPAEKACTKCGSVLPVTKEYFQKVSTRRTGFESRCLTCKKKENKERYWNARVMVLSHYSGGMAKCNCCGESRIEFLSIDHPNGGGRHHRKQIRQEKGSFSSIYLWLISKKLPSGYRVLCMNCNSSLGFFGYCPHQRDRKGG